MYMVFLFFALMTVLGAVAWVGGRYFLGVSMPLPDAGSLRSQVAGAGRKMRDRVPDWREAGHLAVARSREAIHAVRRRMFSGKLWLIPFTAVLIAIIIVVTLHFQSRDYLNGTAVNYSTENKIEQSFADETLSPATPLPPVVFTASVTRQSICPPGHPDCDISAQLNSYFENAAQRFNIEPALLAAIQQNEAPRNNPSIVGGLPSEGDPNDRAIGLMQIRMSIARKLGIDPTSPEQSVFAAARLLSDSLKRNNGNLAHAIAEYHGGTNPANWGPKTESYVTKVFQALHNIRAESTTAGS
jgi:soluble lytic murein transglycosylase-like protein